MALTLSIICLEHHSTVDTDGSAPILEQNEDGAYEVNTEECTCDDTDNEKDCDFQVSVLEISK